MKTPAKLLLSLFALISTKAATSQITQVNATNDHKLTPVTVPTSYPVPDDDGTTHGDGIPMP